MTVDGKIGLLLGFLFIVVIAYLINGPAGFINREKSVKETTVQAPPGKSIVIDQAVAEVARELDLVPLRQSTPPQEVRVIEPIAAEAQAVVQQSLTAASAAPQQTKVIPPLPAAPAPSAVKTHIIQSGENLAVIAARYYGKEEGNKRATIQKLYEANSTILESPDAIRAGDSLRIPTLEQLQTLPNSQPARTENKLLEKFKGIFEPVPTSGTAKAAISETAPKAAYREHLVASGEHLWDIAERYLGDGKRYKEIASLNRQQIPDPDHVPAGIRLKIPAR